MPSIINLGELNSIEYDFMQVTSLEKTFGKFGLASNSYQNLSLSGISYTQIQSFMVIRDIADLLGVSYLQISSLKAPQASSNITGISILDKKPAVFWSGKSLIYAVSYLSVDGTESFAVVEYINGAFKLKEKIDGQVLKLEYSSGSYNIIEKSTGETSYLNYINGSKNLVEFVPGVKKGG